MVLTIAFGFLGMAFLLAFIRLARGPSLPDRVVALDLIASLAVGWIALYSIATNQSVFLDVAIVLALISFLGTVGFAYFIAKGAVPWRQT
jgi:multicomponent Na+:H+ antiporter subunit F